MRGVPIGSPSRSVFALRLGARILLPKPESEASLSSVVTSAGGDTKDPYCEYTSFVTSAGGQTNHSPQSEGIARTTGGTRRHLLIDPLWVGLENQRLGSDLSKDLSHGYKSSSRTSSGGDTKDPFHRDTASSFVTSAGGQTNHSPQSEGVARTTGGTRRRPLIDPLWVGRKNKRL